MNQPFGVATDAQGRILVADKGNDRIDRFISSAPPPPPSPDTTAPTIGLGGKKEQRGSKLVKVTVTVGEAATIEGGGTVKVALVGGSASAAKSKRFKLRPESESLAANQSATLKLRLPKRASKLVGRAQRKGKKAIANVTVTATDATGNQGSAKRKVKLKR